MSLAMGTNRALISRVCGISALFAEEDSAYNKAIHPKLNGVCSWENRFLSKKNKKTI